MPNGKTIEQIYDELMREPWQMTREEFVGTSSDVDERAIRTSAHAQHVHRAVTAGKPVSAAVLQPYALHNVWAVFAMAKALKPNA